MTQDDLITTALDALESADLDEGSRMAAAAALWGDRELGELLEGGTRPPARADSERSHPQRAYLTSISAAGFRGVGGSTTIQLQPGPGLTLVTGRNGCGKSSFSDALELLLTRTSSRWAGRTADWQKGWRNLHQPDTSEVHATFAVDGLSGETRLSAKWEPGGNLSDATFTCVLGGTRSTPDALGWTEAATTHRPLLSYAELGQLGGASPSVLYDSMASILGVGELVDAQQRLTEARKQITQSEKVLKTAAKDLLAVLVDHPDDRAHLVAEELKARTPDPDSVEAALELGRDDAGPDTVVSTLRRLAGLSLPSPAEVEEVRATLRGAAAASSAHESSDSATQLELAELLDQAITFHSRHGDQACPVCEGNTLDEAWREQAAIRAGQLRAEGAAADAARRALTSAIDAARRTLERVPTWLNDVDTTGLGIDVEPLVSRSRALQPARSGSVEELDEILSAWEPFATAARSTQEQAQQRLDDLEDIWKPVSDRVQQWILDARRVGATTVTGSQLKAAEEWIKQHVERVRAARFEPIAEQVRHIWEQLRFSSNVEIDAVTLQGTATRRRIDIDVSVDGTAAPALAVMSQGELNAMALSLFLPRATLPESPFGFVVIDDPVQAMDPARVDGLAKVLREVAQDRQVIVFSHDERLPEAVRRLGIDATILEVHRGDGSRVEVVTSEHPVDRYLHDARAITRSDGVPDALIDRMTVGLCRQAAEAAAIERYRTKALAAGTPHTDVESVVREATTFLARCALAIHGDRERAGDVMTWLNRRDRRLADAAAGCNKAPHAGSTLPDPRRLVEDTKALCAELSRA